MMAVGGKNCPVCGKATVDAFQPFCSSRCANIDLGRWLGEKYSVPVSPNDEDDGAEGETDT